MKFHFFAALFLATAGQQSAAFSPGAYVAVSQKSMRASSSLRMATVEEEVAKMRAAAAAARADAARLSKVRR
jgi:hypothetical protein